VLNNIARFLMPLVITDEQLEEGMAVVAEGLAAVAG
jgi:4-aminobutyrate aminotransferase-like enzyme